MNKTVDYSKLVNDAINGNSSAFEELYKSSLKTAYYTASLLLNNPDDVEDVLQNSYIKAYEKLSELKNPESFESWIKTIVENECKNYIKKEKRIHSPIVFFKNKTEEYSEEWKQPVPQEFVEREELRKNISDIIDSLSPEIRACVVLFHFEEKNLNEISEILNIPLGTVKSRLHNGRKQIEKEFNKLRKKDPTLYSIGAIPVVFALLSYQAKNIVVPAAISESVIASVAGTVSATGAASAAGTATAASAVSIGAASSASATATATAATSIAVKITAVAVASTVAVGGTVAVKNHIENKEKTAATSYFSTTVENEICTTSEILSEQLSETELTTIISTSVSSTTEKAEISTAGSTVAVSSSRVSETENHSTSVKETAVKTTTATTVPSTTVPSTTQTTTKESTTAKTTTTTKQTSTETTVPHTASPENNYGTSGGVITEYTGTDSNVSIPSKVGSETVTAIGVGAFAGNNDIESVRLPSSVTQIGQEAFADCTSLSSVSLPSSLEQIGIGAFYGCSSLASVFVPDGTKTISDEAFAQCSSLRTITIPSSVTSISDDAFDGCDSLTIRCEEGSAAHDFAVENNMNISLI